MEKAILLDNEKEIVRKISYYLERGERTDIIKKEQSGSGNTAIPFKILNKDKLAESVGLQWDTMQRKMKKLGFWCIPERGSAVTERTYYMPIALQKIFDGTELKKNQPQVHSSFDGSVATSTNAPSHVDLENILFGPIDGENT